MQRNKTEWKHSRVAIGMRRSHWRTCGITLIHDVIMTTIASQITSLTVVYSTVYSDADQRKHQNSASLAFVWGIHRDRWLPRTKDQLRGTCFYLMTSSWMIYVARLIGPLVKARWRSYASLNRVTGSENGLPPVRRQAITRNSVNVMSVDSLAINLISS